MRLVLPRLYVILDAALLSQPEIQVARSLADAGVRLLQYRNKSASARELLEKAELEAKIQQAMEETKQLQADSKALDGDKKAIEKVAREKYGMIREGETVYKVRKKN